MNTQILYHYESGEKENKVKWNKIYKNKQTKTKVDNIIGFMKLHVDIKTAL